MNPFNPWIARGAVMTALALMLAACSDGNLTGQVSDTGVVAGTIGNDRNKSGTIEEFSLRQKPRVSALSSVSAGLYDFAGMHVVAVAQDGTVIGSSAVDAQGGFSLPVPKGRTVALMLASKGLSGGWVCQQDLLYEGATADTFVKAVLKLDGDVRAGDFAFNAVNGQPSSAKGEAAPYVQSSAAFLTNDLSGYARCGNPNVVESVAQMDFNFKQQGFDPTIKRDDARFYQTTVVLGLDTSEAGTPHFVGSSAPNDQGVATLRVRHETGQPVKLSPTIVDTRVALDAQTLTTPAWNDGVPATDVAGGKDFGALDSTFIKMAGKVKDGNGRAANAAAVSSNIQQDPSASNRQIAVINGVADDDGRYALLLPIPDKDQTWRVAARSSDRSMTGSSGLNTTAAMQNTAGVNVHDIVVLPAGSARLEGFGSNAVDFITASTTDANDNLIVIGATDAALPDQTNQGGRDFFVRKYDSAGTLLWTKQFGSDKDDKAADVIADANGNMYVVGQAQDDLYEANHQGSSVTANSFVMKLTANGTRLWTKMLSTSNSNDNRAKAVQMNSTGDLFVAGQTFGEIEGSGSTSGGADMYLVKIAAGGLAGSTAPTRQWSTQYAVSGEDAVVDMLFDASDNLYLSGYTTGNLGGNNAGGRDVFLFRYLDAQLDQSWLGSNLSLVNFRTQWGTAGNDDAATLALDGAGNLFVAGAAGNGSLDGNTATTSFAAFATKFAMNAAGEPAPAWTRTWVGAPSGVAAAIDVAADQFGNAYVIGYDADNGTDYLALKTHMFVRKLQPDGVTGWSRTFASANGAGGFSVTRTAQNKLALGGWSDATIGQVSNIGGWDALLVTINLNGN